MRFAAALIAIPAVTALLPVWAGDALTDTRLTLEKWVETRQLISKTRSDWQTDKDTLEQTVALYERELKSLDEQMAKVATNNTQVANEMAEAEALKKASNEARDSAAKFATEFEAKLKKLAPQFPTPLQDIIKKDLARIPAAAAHHALLGRRHRHDRLLGGAREPLALLLGAEQLGLDHLAQVARGRTQALTAPGGGESPPPTPALHAGLIVEREGRVEGVVAWDAPGYGLSDAIEPDVRLFADALQ